MSVIVIITPVIVGGWPIFSALIAAAAARLGFKLLQKTTRAQAVETTNEIELVEENSKIIEESLKAEEQLIFTREGITVTCKKDVREKFTICVSGKNLADDELRQIGQSFLNQIKQQYAYQKVTEEMTKRGYTLVEEQIEGRKIRLLLRKY